jgi:hypothetical protein
VVSATGCAAVSPDGAACCAPFAPFAPFVPPRDAGVRAAPAGTAVPARGTVIGAICGDVACAAASTRSASASARSLL